MEIFRKNFEKLKFIYEEEIPFNNKMGIEIVENSDTNMSKTCFLFNYLDYFAGNAVHNTLHGGIAASLVDTSGGLTTAKRMLSEEKELLSLDRVREISSKVATVNIRTDYLRPGIGKSFKTIGEVEKYGKKLAVIRMKVVSDTGKTVVIGVGTYTTGYCSS